MKKIADEATARELVLEFGHLKFEADLDTAKIEEAVKAVEGNNDLNGGKWSDWRNSLDIVTVYEIAGLPSVGHQILNRAIASNGGTLAIDLPDVSIAVFGQAFAGSFWDR